MDLLNMDTFSHIIEKTAPAAIAVMQGGAQAPRVSGTIRFYPAGRGTLVAAEVFGLPRQVTVKGEAQKAGPFYAFHIHEGADCGSGAGDDPFASAKNHFNPGVQPHPLHAGDMPPILSDSGYSYISFYTGRYTPGQILGRTVIIHQNPDDFRTQPSGNAGMKIACGVVTATE